MQKIISNRNVENCNKVHKYHKDVLSGEIKKVQMVDGIMIFELQRTFWKTLEIVLKNFFHGVWGVILVTKLKNDMKL